MQTAADSFLNPSADPDARLGCEIGLEYRVVRHLASGGMASVFLAEHSRDGSYAAAKFIEPASGVPASLLQYEAYQLARIRNPHVVRALEYGRTRQGLDYLLLEYVSGIDLAEWIASARQGMPRPRWLHVLSQLADAIDCLHASGVVHGDIKPANVMLDPNHGDAVKLIDFGLAFEWTSARNLVAGTGTPGYMAPEQVRGDACGPAIDRYAFAVVAYELLMRTAPQPSAADTDVSADAVDLRALHEAHPAWLPVFGRALHERPNLRFASARAFVAALSRANADLGAELALRTAAWRKSCGQARSAPRNRVGGCGTACE